MGPFRTINPPTLGSSHQHTLDNREDMSTSKLTSPRGGQSLRVSIGNVALPVKGSLEIGSV